MNSFLIDQLCKQKSERRKPAPLPKDSHQTRTVWHSISSDGMQRLYCSANRSIPIDINKAIKILKIKYQTEATKKTYEQNAITFTSLQRHRQLESNLASCDCQAMDVKAECETVRGSINQHCSTVQNVSILISYYQQHPCSRFPHTLLILLFFY